MAERNPKFEGLKLKATAVFKTIWLIVAIALYATGAYMFFRDKGFGNWMFWGFCCSFALIVKLFKFGLSSGKDGERAGANTYTVSNGKIHNNPVKTAILYFVIGIVAGVAIGPVWLAFEMLAALSWLIVFFVNVAKNRKEGGEK